MRVEICVGSSCHLKGSSRVVELFQAAVRDAGLESQVELAGSFCLGECSRQGVTVSVDGEIVPGVTPEGFDEFFKTYIRNRLK